jgi:hypothetical protein
MQLNIPEHHSISAMVETRERNDREWTIHYLGEVIAVYHNKECGPCFAYTEHILSHPGSFNLRDENMIGAIEKVWPHFILALEQKLTLPLVRDNADLTGRLKRMSEQLDELKDKYKDLCDKNSQLID